MKKVVSLLVLFLAFGICAYAGEAMDLQNPDDPAEVVKLIKSEIDLAKVSTGQVQSYIVKFKTKEGGEKGRAVGVILIDAPYTKVREILGDWASMPEYVPNLKYYKVKYTYPQDELPDGVIRRRLIEGKIGISFLTAVYPVDVQLREDNRTEGWKLIKKEEAAQWKNKGVDLAPPFWGIKDIGGLGYLESTEDGRTIYYYSPVIETTVPVPNVILSTVMKLTLPGYMEGVKKRVESNGTWTRKGSK
jgi:hypothetical protein